MAKNETQTVEETPNEESSVAAQIPAELLRYMKVPPADFKAAVVERGLSSKEVAKAIGRTLSRVSELTHSKGASRAIYDEFITKVDAFIADRETETPAEESAPEAEAVQA